MKVTDLLLDSTTKQFLTMFHKLHHTKQHIVEEVYKNRQLTIAELTSAIEFMNKNFLMTDEEQAADTIREELGI
jgi:hypothetical protein